MPVRKHDGDTLRLLIYISICANNGQPNCLLYFRQINRSYTARNAQLAASLLSSSRYQDAFPSHRLLRLDSKYVNRLAASCELHTGLIKVVSSTCSKPANIKLHQVGRSQTYLDEVNRLDTTCWQLASGR